MATIDEQFTALATRMAQECNDIRSETGLLQNLQTTAKSTLVAAINEVLGIAQAGGGGSNPINDGVIGTSTTWSSTKINTEIQAAAGSGGAQIDDGAPATNKVWSSSKTNNEIGGQVGSAIGGLTKNSVGLGNVDNTSDANKPVSTAQAAADASVLQQAKDYADSLPSGGAEIDDNSTGTTTVWSSQKTNNVIGSAVAGIDKTSLGLGNVDNTSDANKPVSAAQAAADNLILTQANAYTDANAIGMWNDRGNYDASSNQFPSTGGTGAAGAIEKGNIWTISVAGTLGGTAVVPKQSVRALVDNPGQTPSNWAINTADFAITQTITNGVTGQAPSADAVFDALQLKQNAIPLGTGVQYFKGDLSLGTFATDVRTTQLGGAIGASSPITSTDTVLTALWKAQAQINTLDAEVAAVDKTSIGLGNVDNTSDVNKPVSTAQAAADASVLQQANAYTDAQVGGAGAQIDDGAPVTNKVWSSSKTDSEIDAAVAGVTKTSLGLGNVDNTSDINKPVSTAQAAADTAALNQAKAYADGLVVGLWDDRGNYDASGNTFPSTGGSGTAGAVLKGDIWTISVAGNLGGTAVVPKQTVRALVDAPAQTSANWAISTGGTGSVADAIVDGVTNVAPSQNAVYDALLGKQNVITTGNTTQYLRGDLSLATLDKTAVGLANVDNTSDANKPVSTATQTALNGKQNTITTGTTAQYFRGDLSLAVLDKTTVGLGNVDNTSDANKPVSTAQAAADTNTLNSARAYADGLVVGLWDDRGNYNASGNVFPSTGGSGSAGAILKGDVWTISVAGTLGGTGVVPGQTVRAIADAPGQTDGNWAISSSPGGAVADAIVDGVTNVAPSQNAVFDALAGKEPTITTLPIAKGGTGSGTASGALTALGAVPLAGGVALTGPLGLKRGADIASAATLNLDAATGDIVNVTGTTTITAITLADGAVKRVRFTGALQLTNSATLQLPAGANITTVAGDWAEFIGMGGGTVMMSGYAPSSGYAKLSGNFTTAGGFPVTLTATAATNVTLPTSGTLATTELIQNSQSANYTCVLSDAGKHIYHPSADTTARTITIPANASVAYPIGSALTFVNDNAAGALTIAITSDTLRWAGDGGTGSRTLNPNGIATALKITATSWMINGTGLA